MDFEEGLRGNPVDSRPLPKTQPLQVRFPLLKRVVLRSWRPSKEVPKPRPGKVPKKCSGKCRSETGCRGKCRKSAPGSVSLYYFHRETEPGALFWHFSRHPVSDRHFPEHFFGTFPRRGFGTSLDGRQDRKSSSEVRGCTKKGFFFSEDKKAYTTTTERKSFGELFWPQRKTFQVGGGHKNPMKTRKSICIYIYTYIYILPKSFLCGPHFFGKDKFCTGAGRCMLSFSQFLFSKKKQRSRDQDRPSFKAILSLKGNCYFLRLFVIFSLVRLFLKNSPVTVLPSHATPTRPTRLTPPRPIPSLPQDHGKGGLSVRGVAVMTETAMTAKTAKTVKTATVASLCCNF